MKKKIRKCESMNLELCGGIFFVEKYKDGTEKRDEIDGEMVLKLLLKVVEDYADKIIKEN